MMIERELKFVIEESIRYFSAITITGPRQSGKTTLVRDMFPKMPYYSLENPDIREQALTDPMAFLQRHPSGMILDEVQNTPQLLSYLQGIIDEHPNNRYILSGSAQFSLIQAITQSLAGRTAMLDLLPLSISELSSVGHELSTDQLLYSGFYPALHSGRNIPRLFYPNYLSTYIERDLRQLLMVKDLRQFNTFLRLCAGRIGSIFNASELSNEVGVSVNTIKAWLSILQASYILFLLPPYYENTRTRLVKSPKLYFYDVGLAAYLLQVEDEQDMQVFRMRGYLFENMVIAECKKHYLNRDKQTDLMFYRDAHGNEIDLIIANRDTFDAIEIKSSQTFNNAFNRGLKIIQERLGERVGRKAVIYDGQTESVNTEYELLNYRTFIRSL